ncbi:hypothetical protein DCC81_20610 [Chitinophaga parva]|uniref:Uncharacterized protein n=1 Tax=Chitinophaga parva TaxID=2169414 RepID=A0A2T7BCK1_9BACT|nr:hypothetical protein [Chitinophaga parva]PUZ22826.1 hypothetical protein DCC81_20610 [Chitinophaga parva]
MKYLWLVFTLLTLQASAQQYTFVTSDAEETDFMHQTFTTTSGKYVDLQYAFPLGPLKYRNGRNAIVCVYDHQLKQLLSKPLDATAGKRFLQGYTIGEKLILFFADKDNGVQPYELHLEDGTASMVADLIKPADDNTYPSMGASPDKSHFYVVFRTTHKNDPGTYTGIVIDQQFKVVTKIATSDDVPDKNIDHIQYALSDDGVFNIIAAEEGSDSKKDYNPFNYTITQISPSGKAATGHLAGIPAGLFTNIAWHADKNNLQFTGLLEEGKNADFTTVISGVYDGTQKKITELKKTDLAEKIPHGAKFVTSYPLKDHSTVITLEPASSTDVEHVMVPDFNSGGLKIQHNAATIDAGNLYVIKINPNHELAWAKTVYKSQTEMNYRVYTGAAVLPDNNDGFHIFFQDCMKNTEVEDTKPRRIVAPGGKNDGLAVVYISKDGNMTKKFLEPSFNHDHYSDLPFSPLNTVADGGNRLIYVSYRHRNLGRSLYHVSAVTVE